jgi:hypothetical protein
MKSDDQVNVSSEDKSTMPPSYEKDGIHGSDTEEQRQGDVELVETTHRGLKARHAQMIALGGTIGTLLHSIDLKPYTNEKQELDCSSDPEEPSLEAALSSFFSPTVSSVASSSSS